MHDDIFSHNTKIIYKKDEQQIPQSLHVNLLEKKNRVANIGGKSTVYLNSLSKEKNRG